MSCKEAAFIFTRHGPDEDRLVPAARSEYADHYSPSLLCLDCLPYQRLSTGHATGVNSTLRTPCQDTYASVTMWCHAWLRAASHDFHGAHPPWFRALKLSCKCHVARTTDRSSVLSADSVWNVHPSLISLGCPLRVQRQLRNAKWFFSACVCWWADSPSFVTFHPVQISLVMFVITADGLADRLHTDSQTKYLFPFKDIIGCKCDNNFARDIEGCIYSKGKLHCTVDLWFYVSSHQVARKICFHCGGKPERDHFHTLPRESNVRL